MSKKVIALFIVVMLILASMAPVAMAGDSGETILYDTMYGGLIGGLLGGAWYLLDDTDASDKIGTGIGIGIIGGFLLGITDATATVSIENGDVKFAMPQIILKHTKNETSYKTGLLQVNF